ncbi:MULTISPECIES: hypothetical protein [unclassified Streptomyces]|uniref:hypothetical protein n=1 Tax=unclassified Streptomyces TaxID=2593676 RepID=UPI002E28B0B0|nr:hypothetical protein [Streptomyces sp. NBC_00223]
MLLPGAGARTELIEVVRVTSATRDVFPGPLDGEDVALWAEDEVRQVPALITELPEGARRRCFTPGWGIRAHGATALLFEISFCFSCNGARLWGPEVPAEHEDIHVFDADSPSAHALLSRFRAAGSG